jgi:hypothetical protein
LLEKELILQKYNNERNSQLIIEELIYYSNKYSTLKSFESAKEKFRNILDQNMFSRTQEQQKQIEELFKDKILRKNTYTNSFLLRVQHNTLYYWKFGSENDWEKAHRYALKNYKLILENPEKIKLFPEASIAEAAISSNPSIILPILQQPHRVWPTRIKYTTPIKIRISRFNLYPKIEISMLYIFHR